MVHPVSRRTALLGAAGTLTLTGCSVDSLRPTPPAPAPDPDAALIDTVASRIVAVRAIAPPRLRAMHADHLRALGAAVPPVTGRPAATAAVRSAETDLRALLQDACVGATDPALVRLLASMAAAVAQGTQEWT